MHIAIKIVAATVTAALVAVVEAADGYVYLAPFVEEADYFFLKTVIPSRKATRDYFQQSETNAKRLHSAATVR